MRITTTLAFTDEHRRLVARFLGRDGLASAVECTAWAKQQIVAALAVMARAAAERPRPSFAPTREIREGEHGR